MHCMVVLIEDSGSVGTLDRLISTGLLVQWAVVMSSCPHQTKRHMTWYLYEYFLLFLIAKQRKMMYMVFVQVKKAL